MEMMIIDSHVNFWKFKSLKADWVSDKNMKLLQKDYLPDHLRSSLINNEVQGVIAIQAEESEVETLWLIELANTYDWIFGVVGWVDMMGENTREKIYEFSQHRRLRGYRYPLNNKPFEVVTNRTFRYNMSLLKDYDYTFDLVIRPDQADSGVILAQAYPHQVLILNHCGLPDIRSKEMNQWKEAIKELATYPNVFCKLSGLLTQAHYKKWSPADFYPYFDVLFENFGTHRLMFGSDWPTMLLSGSYLQWKSLIEKYMENMTFEEKDAVMGFTTARVYDKQWELIYPISNT
jgi:L-fuconolactonase